MFLSSTTFFYHNLEGESVEPGKAIADRFVLTIASYFLGIFETNIIAKSDARCNNSRSPYFFSVMSKIIESLQYAVVCGMRLKRSGETTGNSSFEIYKLCHNELGKSSIKFRRYRARPIDSIACHLASPTRRFFFFRYTFPAIV